MTTERQKTIIAYPQPATCKGNLLDSELLMDLSMDIWRNKVSGKYFIYLGDTGQEESLFVTPVGEIKSLEKGLFEEVVEEVEANITEPQEQRFQEYIEKRRVYIASRIVDMIAEMEPYDLEEFVRRVKKRENRQRRFDQDDDGAM